MRQPFEGCQSGVSCGIPGLLCALGSVSSSKVSLVSPHLRSVVTVYPSQGRKRVFTDNS